MDADLQAIEAKLATGGGSFSWHEAMALRDAWLAAAKVIESQSAQIAMLVKDASAALAPTKERLRGRMEERERIVQWLQIKASHPLNGHAARNVLNDAADAISRGDSTEAGEPK